MKNSTKKTNKGFAMLFAVLVSSVLLSIGISIFNLTIKELALSSSGRESQFSFFAADSGAECALYWDINGTEVFATSTDSRNPSPASPDCVDTAGAQQIITNNNYITTYSGYPLGRSSNYAVTQFNLTIPNSTGNYCAVVTVIKDASSGTLITTIDSRGYNTCVASDPNRVERALKVTY
jgi:hypothetical protein